MEEIRAKYYREMKRFICIPLHFRGVGDTTSAAGTIFPAMIDRNAVSFFTVYKKVATSTFNYIQLSFFTELFWCCCSLCDLLSFPLFILLSCSQAEQLFTRLQAAGKVFEGVGGTGSSRLGQSSGAALQHCTAMGEQLQSHEEQRERRSQSEQQHQNNSVKNDNCM